MKENGAGSPGICAREYDLFVGLDVDKRSMAVTVVDHEQFAKALKMRYDSQALIGYLQKHFAGKRIALAYEAGVTGYGLYDDLTQAGYTCLVTAPANVPMEASRRVKTNRLDSQHLAVSLRGGQLRGIRVPTRIYRDLRPLAHLRQAHSQEAQAYQRRIRMLLLNEGLSFPWAKPGSRWSKRVLKELEAWPCSPAIRRTLDSLLQSLAFHREQLQTVQRQLLERCQEDSQVSDSVRYAQSAPGVGEVVATQVVAHVGDWRGLTHARELGAFFGLVPCENSTGDEIRKGSITHAGDPYLRSLLVEAAWSAIRQDAELSAFYQRIRRRHPPDRGSRIAIVAVARKLATRLFCLLKERRCYVYN